MKYFVVDTTYIDGEYEYLQQSVIEAKSMDDATAMAEGDAEDWTKYDYREYEVGRIIEITKEEYTIISKYIY